MPIGSRRCIDYSLRSLARAGITEIVVTTSYKADMIVDALEATDVGGLSMVFSFERHPMGTAGGVRKCLPFLDDTFIVLSADVLADVDLGAMVESHRRKGAVATMALTEVEHVQEYGVVALDAHGRIERFQEKPRPEEAFSNLINAGIYVLEPEALEKVPEGTKFDFSRNLFPLLLEGGHPMFGHRLAGLWMDIGRPRDLILANKAMVEREGSEDASPLEGVQGTVQVGEGVNLDQGATVKGPSMLDDGVRIGPGARVSSSFLHSGVTVEEGASVVDSILLPDCIVGPHSRLVHSIVDENSVIGDGAHLLNTMVGRGSTVGPMSHHEDQVLGDQD
jgi:NDP-sugar pyrophosphorylase family protein